MCEYCGCQAVTAIEALTEEHEQIRAVADDACRRADAADIEGARARVTEVLALLNPHTAIEERGLFPALAEEFGPAMSRLVHDHRELDAAFGALCGGSLSASEVDRQGWAQALVEAVRGLFEHILREQDGVFPAALSMLKSEHWDHLDQVRTELTGVPEVPGALSTPGAALS